MQSSHSISQWIATLKEGDAEAAQRIWDHYSARLLAAARRKLRVANSKAADEEDVAQSVFHSVCRGAAAGRFADVKNRDDLWWVLLAVTKQKVVDQVRREMAKKRGKSRVYGESSMNSGAPDRPHLTLDDLAGTDPTPDYLVILDEQHDRLLGMLRDDRLRQIAISRIEGYTIPEIASVLDVSLRTVERKLQLIRKAWAGELNRAD